MVKRSANQRWRDCYLAWGLLELELEEKSLTDMERWIYLAATELLDKQRERSLAQDDGYHPQVERLPLEDGYGGDQSPGWSVKL